MTWDIIGQSRRGERATEQGEGSEGQIPYRAAFQHCTELWNSLPEECPAVVPDPPPTSKKSVWDAKLEHGVVCSYFDLFMRCCIMFAQENGGAMPDGDCFPCESNCDCTNISIGYTTQGMQVNEEQTLTVEGGVDGCVYAWGLVGGGTLSGEEGDSVVYTAPATNPNCESNAVVSLSVGGAQCDSLGIAINAYYESKAYEIKWVTGYGVCCAYSPHSCHPNAVAPDCDPQVSHCGRKTYYMIAQYSCSGAELKRCASEGFICDYSIPEGDNFVNHASCFNGGYLGMSTPLGTTDIRSESKIASGCCPPGLL